MSSEDVGAAATNADAAAAAAGSRKRPVAPVPEADEGRAGEERQQPASSKTAANGQQHQQQQPQGGDVAAAAAAAGGRDRRHHHPRGKHLHWPPSHLFAFPAVPPPENALLSVIPDDVLERSLSFLDAPSLIRVRAVNRKCRNLASANELWEGLCQTLWRDKVHVAPEAVQCTENRMRAYRISLEDANERGYMHRSEFCFDHPGRGGDGTVWSFRFKESAGTDWTSVDPWYSGKKARKFVFLTNGTVKQYIEENDDQENSAGGGDNGRQQLPHRESGAARQGERQQPRMSIDSRSSEHIYGSGGEGDESRGSASSPPRYRLINTPMPMRWRFITRPMDLPARPMGGYVRMTVNDRDVPTYSVRRSPTKNWGFLMESCWGVYASFELPLRRMPSSASNEEGMRTTHPRRRRLLRRNEGGEAIWQEIEDDTGNSSNDNNNGCAEEDLDDRLRDDSSMIITNELQWREAFMYNTGARQLPHGDEAMARFDQAWPGGPDGM